MQMLKVIAYEMGVESGAQITGRAYNFIFKLPLARSVP